MFRDMLVFDYVRGVHSTGVLNLSLNNKQGVYKCLGGPENLMKYADFDNRSVFNKGSKLLLGHNRMATVGAVTEDNAHPFYAGNVTGAHNGTLSTENAKKLDCNDLFEVDSECLLNNISDNGLSTLTKLTEGLHTGAWALTYYDVSDNTLNLIRNEHRPLYYTFSKAEDVLFWASEPWMISVAAARHGVKHGDIEPLPINKHFSISLKKFRIHKEDFVEGDMFRGKKRVQVKTQSYTSYYRQGAEAAKRISNTPVMYGNQTKVATSKTEKEKLRALKNTVVEFSLDHKIQPTGKRNSYYRGTVLSPDLERDIEVRVFLKDTPYEKNYSVSDIYRNIWKGTVKGYRNKKRHGEYILINVSSMEEVKGNNVVIFTPTEEKGGEGEVKKQQSMQG